MRPAYRRAQKESRPRGNAGGVTVRRSLQAASLQDGAVSLLLLREALCGWLTVTPQTQPPDREGVVRDGAKADAPGWQRDNHTRLIASDELWAAPGMREGGWGMHRMSAQRPTALFAPPKSIAGRLLPLCVWETDHCEYTPHR
ncbi:MAG: hypothetical protein Tsb0013_05270 [Phycisphaerales bacterium]